MKDKSTKLNNEIKIIIHNEPTPKEVTEKIKELNKRIKIILGG